MFQKILPAVLISVIVSFSNAFACDCIFPPEATRSIEDLTETAAEEDRFVILVKILGKESRIRNIASISYAVEGYRAEVIEILGGCIEYNEVFIPEAGPCSDYDVSGIEIGDTGLVLGFRENEDYISAIQCDTRISYYNTDDDKMDSSTGLTRTAISMNVLRKFDTCSLMYEVYPNPSSKSIQITLDKELIRETVPVTLYDEGGRLVLRAKGPTTAVDQLPAGMYFLQVGNNKNTTPLVVTH